MRFFVELQNSEQPIFGSWKIKSSIMDKCPNLISTISVPKVLWYQTDASVVLRIMLPGIENYFLRLDEDHVRFSTIIGEQNYYLCVYLFGAVIAEKCMHFNKGREVVVYLPKAHRWVNWLRLGLDKRQNHQIIPDPERIEDDEVPIKTNEEFKECLKEYMRQNNITQILPAGDTTDEDESDDEKYDALFD